MKPSILLPLLLFLTACQVLEDGGDGRLPSGTPLDLHQDLIVPPNQAGAFIQGTRIGDRHRYDAVCRLEVRTVDATFRTVTADRFTVVRVRREAERFSQQESGLRRVSLFGRDGPALLRFTTVLHLHSERQPDVFRLVCSHLQDSARQPRHLTTDEIRTVLTPVMTLHRTSVPH
jgi:hypothetical protein